MQRLASYADTSSFRVYYTPPTDATFPYVTFLGKTSRPRLTTTTIGDDSTVTLKVCTRQKKGAVSPGTMYDMKDAVKKALTDSRLTLSGGHTCIFSAPEFDDELPPYDDDAFTYLEGVLRFRFLTQYVAA